MVQLKVCFIISYIRNTTAMAQMEKVLGTLKDTSVLQKDKVKEDGTSA